VSALVPGDRSVSGAGGDVVVLARIDAARFYDRSEAYREEVRTWMRANGVDPHRVTCARDVEVVLLDGPAIVREEYLFNERGAKYLVGPVGPDGTREPAVRVVHSLLRVPLPEHLADPT
jgi:hypothetical protein